MFFKALQNIAPSPRRDRALGIATEEIKNTFLRSNWTPDRILQKATSHAWGWCVNTEKDESPMLIGTTT